MTLFDRLGLLGLLDALARGIFGLCWVAIGWWIERTDARSPSVTVLMMQQRRDWMRQMVTRPGRIFDGTILSSLRQGVAFFASTSVLAIGGALALIGNAERIEGVAEGLGTSAPLVIWQVKLGLVVLVLVEAFLKFVWSSRLFGYCAVVMAAVPNRSDDPEAFARAAQAAELNIRAAWNFNRGLRAMYFALASVTWLVGPLPLIAATLSVVWVLWSREFRSKPRDILLGRI